MDLHRRAGHRFGTAWVKIGLGELARAEGRPADAVTLHTEAAGLFGLLGHRDSQAWALDGLGRTESLRGRPTDAVRHHKDALNLFPPPPLQGTPPDAATGTNPDFAGTPRVGGKAGLVMRCSDRAGWLPRWRW